MPQRMVKDADLQGLFHAVMRRYQVNVQDIKNQQRATADVPGYGNYVCVGCANSWESPYSWLTIDLKQMIVFKRWKMKCRHCLVEIKPTFSVEQAEKMIERAICWYKGQKCERGDNSHVRPKRRNRPHKEILCEKCEWGASRCWTRPPSYTFI